MAQFRRRNRFQERNRGPSRSAERRLKGTNPTKPYTQNTSRDGMLATSCLNLFHQHFDRTRTTSVSLAIDVLPSLILIEGSNIALTPSYNAFKVLMPLQDETSHAKLTCISTRAVLNRHWFPANVSPQTRWKRSSWSINPQRLQQRTILQWQADAEKSDQVFVMVSAQ